MSLSDSKPRVLCFGEILWDCFPDVQLLGGAPFNVAYHLQKLGCEAIMVSAVGADRLGEETLERMSAMDLSTSYVARHPHIPTGVVDVKLDTTGQPTYHIVPDVAWDQIPVDKRVLNLVGSCEALIYGSLAARSPANQAAVHRLLQIPDPRRIMDVNLRRPYDQHSRVLDLCRRAHLVKLNEEELGHLTGLPGLPGCDGNEPRMAQAIASFAQATGVREVCVTLGSRGAAYWREGRIWTASAPSVQVRDTVGAGDAFTAALTAGLLADDSDDAMAETLRRACALGALVASLPGAQPDYNADSYSPEAK